MDGEFRGFTRDAIDFMAELAAHNDRSWFQPRKAEFERLLKRPLEALCVELDERFKRREMPLLSDPVRSPFRIYRDVRFSPNKSPYTTHVSAGFPWFDDGGVGCYFHFEPGEMLCGGGMWAPVPAKLAEWRRLIDRDCVAARALVDDPTFVAAWGKVEGSAARRMPPGFAADHPAADLLRMKEVMFNRRLSDADVLSPELPDILADYFAAALPLIRILAGLPPQADMGRRWLR